MVEPCMSDVWICTLVQVSFLFKVWIRGYRYFPKPERDYWICLKVWKNKKIQLQCPLQMPVLLALLELMEVVPDLYKVLILKLNMEIVYLLWITCFQICYSSWEEFLQFYLEVDVEIIFLPQALKLLYLVCLTVQEIRQTS